MSDDLINRQEALDGKINLLIRCDDDKLRFKDVVPVEYLQNMSPAEPEQRWIPVMERPPEDDTEVIVSCTDNSGDSPFSYTTTGWRFGRIWIVDNERNTFVRAWRPLPEPWRGEKDD